MPATQSAPVTGRARRAPRTSDDLLGAIRRQDVAREEEQRRLGEGVVHRVKQCPPVPHPAEADAHAEDAHVLHAGIGEHALVVGLADDQPRRDAHGHQPEDQDGLPAECPRPAALHTARMRRMARNAQFRRAPESRADTTEGASLCASGSHVCMGARPIFVP